MFSLFLDFFHWLPSYFFPKLCFDCGIEGTWVCKKCLPHVKNLIKTKSLICPICQKLSLGGWAHPTCGSALPKPSAKEGLDRLISFYEYDGWAKKIIKNVKFKKNKIYRALTDLSTEFALALKGDSLRFTLSLSKGKVSPYKVSAFSAVPINGSQLTINSMVLVPVPLHWYRQLKRGLNQSSIIAQALGRGLNIPVNEKILKRIRHTAPQTLIDRASRLKNIRGAFSIGPEFFSEKFAGTLEPLPKRSMSRVRIEPKRRMLSWVGPVNSPNLPYLLKDLLFLLVDDVWTTGTTLSECCRVLKRAGAKQVWALTLLRA